MTFDQSAFTDTLRTIHRDLEQLEAAIAWFAPIAYERGTGTGRSVICRRCDGKGKYLPEGATIPVDCNDCVVATIGDAGEIVIRRWNLASHLEQTAREVERIWELSAGMRDRIAKLASLVDHGAHEPGISEPTVDPRELPALWAAKQRRVARGEDLPASAGIDKHVRQTARQNIKTQDAIDAAVAKREAGGAKTGNRWRGKH